MRSDVDAISPFVDSLIHLIRESRWVPGNEEEIEVALRGALANTSFTAIMKIPGSRSTLAVVVTLTAPPSSGMKDKDMTLASSQTLPLPKISAQVMAVVST